MTRLSRPQNAYGPHKRRRREVMCQTDYWIWVRPNSPMIDYGPDQRRVWVRPNIPNSGMGQTEQTNDWLRARSNRPKSDMSQTEQTDDGVWARTKTRYVPDRTYPIQEWARQNRPTNEYGPEQTDSIQVWARQNRSNSGMGQTEQRDQKFVKYMSSVAPDPLSASQVRLVHSGLGLRTSSWAHMTTCSGSKNSERRFASYFKFAYTL